MGGFAKWSYRMGTYVYQFEARITKVAKDLSFLGQASSAKHATTARTAYISDDFHITTIEHQEY